MITYGKFTTKIPTLENEINLANAGISFLANEDGMCWYDAVKILNSTDTNKFVLLINDNNTIVSILEKSVIDSFFPQNLSVATTDDLPEDVVPYLWNVVDGELEKNEEFLKYLNVLEKNKLIDVANDKIEFIQDMIDVDGETDKLKKSLLEWKKYRIQLKQLDAEQVEVAFPKNPKN